MVILIRADGTEKKVNPKDEATGFTLPEMHSLIECGEIEIIQLADGRRMAVSEDFTDRAINVKATVLFQEGRTTALAIRGNALVGTKGEIWRVRE